MKKIKLSFLPSVLLVIIAAVIFVVGAHAFSLPDYTKALSDAKTQYDNAISQAQTAYNAAVAAATKTHTDALNALGSQSSNESAAVQIENTYNDALDKAQADLELARKKATEAYSAGRTQAWNQYAAVPAPNCVPITNVMCAADGWVCGDMPDGCGGVVSCGTCQCPNGPCNSNFTMTNLSVSPASTASTPYKAGDTVTSSFDISNWSWVKDNVKIITIKSQTSDTVPSQVNNVVIDPDFDMAVSDIKAQNLCDAGGHCKAPGTFTAAQFACTGNVNDVMKREEWLQSGTVQSNHLTFYFKCSGTSPSPGPEPAGVITMTPSAFASRYTPYCGIANGPSVAAGATRYYKVDMSKWIEWQRQYFSVWKSAFLTRNYDMCMSGGAAAISQYNSSCDPATGNPKGLVNGVCATNECFALVMMGTCKSAPDPNYAQTCAANQTAGVADADSKLKVQEDLYKTGKYTSVFSGSSGVGCNPYVGNAGCEGQGNTFDVALGYNQTPIFENIFVFSPAYNTAYDTYLAATRKNEQDMYNVMANCRAAAGQQESAATQCMTDAVNARDNANYSARSTFCNLAKQGGQGNVEANFGVNCDDSGKGARYTDPISAAIPIAAAIGYLNGSGTEGGPYASFQFSNAVLGADYVYLMIHNADGPARTFEFEMGCPGATAK